MDCRVTLGVITGEVNEGKTFALRATCVSSRYDCRITELSTSRPCPPTCSAMLACARLSAPRGTWASQRQGRMEPVQMAYRMVGDEEARQLMRQVANSAR
jgi:hypothetical protein